VDEGAEVEVGEGEAAGAGEEAPTEEGVSAEAVIVEVDEEDEAGEEVDVVEAQLQYKFSSKCTDHSPGQIRLT